MTRRTLHNVRAKHAKQNRVVQEAVADFKARLALLMRKAIDGESYSVLGAAKSNQCVTRKAEPAKCDHDLGLHAICKKCGVWPMAEPE